MMKIDEQNDEEDEYEIFLSFFYKKKLKNWHVSFFSIVNGIN
jgi:hypothetical protein